MPKRSVQRDTAKAEYIARRKRGQEVNLKQLAEELGVPVNTMRNWKALDKWEDSIPRKRGAQPGNRNAKGNKGGGAPEGNSNAEKDGAYWEMDTVYSGQGKSRKALLVLTERMTRKEIIIPIQNRKAETIVKALDCLERKLGAAKFRRIFKAITADNGTEFAAAKELERSCINKTTPRTKLYYCHPYSSWERGSNENINGMIRRRHPKGTDFAKVPKEEISKTEAWINHYPRKILGYRSSEMEFQKCLEGLGIQL